MIVEVAEFDPDDLVYIGVFPDDDIERYVNEEE